MTLTCQKSLSHVCQIISIGLVMWLVCLYNVMCTDVVPSVLMFWAGSQNIITKKYFFWMGLTVEYWHLQKPLTSYVQIAYIYRLAEKSRHLYCWGVQFFLLPSLIDVTFVNLVTRQIQTSMRWQQKLPHLEEKKKTFIIIAIYKSQELSKFHLIIVILRISQRIAEIERLLQWYKKYSTEIEYNV